MNSNFLYSFGEKLSDLERQIQSWREYEENNWGAFIMYWREELIKCVRNEDDMEEKWNFLEF